MNLACSAGTSDALHTIQSLKVYLTKSVTPQRFPRRIRRRLKNAAPAEPWYAPFTNVIAVIMMCWQYTKSATKSASEMDRLAHSLGDSMWDGFNIKDFTKFNTA